MCQSLVGHCLGGSGGLEANATIKAIQTGWLHPSINQFVSKIAVDMDNLPKFQMDGVIAHSLQE